MTVAAAITFTWLGMVLAISFLEAPLKFRAPGVTLPLGLGIGRVVFAALNKVEAGLALGVVVFVVIGPRTVLAVVFAAVALLALLVQLEDGPRSHAHFVYIGLEVLKVAALLAFGVAALA
ncbi:hypothetical protein [Amycolatopsis sp. MEPSY49]|uniref:hypothetical protein n=1 Tax=Amycolatopsis sp. MEPSY49 TaxID=3151600 RepID=UPI003EF35EA2